MLSGVPQGSVFCPVLCNVFINDLCISVKYARYFLFADDVNIFRTMSPATDCTLLKSDTSSIRCWSIAG